MFSFMLPIQLLTLWGCVFFSLWASIFVCLSLSVSLTLSRLFLSLSLSHVCLSFLSLTSPLVLPSLYVCLSLSVLPVNPNLILSTHRPTPGTLHPSLTSPILPLFLLPEMPSSSLLATAWRLFSPVSSSSPSLDSWPTSLMWRSMRLQMQVRMQPTYSKAAQSLDSCFHVKWRRNSLPTG